MRFDIRQSNGTWQVINADTGEVVKVNDRFMEGLPLEDADDLADLLNLIESKRPPRDN